MHRKGPFEDEKCADETTGRPMRPDDSGHEKARNFLMGSADLDRFGDPKFDSGECGEAKFLGLLDSSPCLLTSVWRP